MGDDVKKQHDDLKPQAFTYRPANLPNYEKRPGPQLEQEPLSPDESMKHIQVPVGFTLDLFAHEPGVMHPIAMTWDERGRLYVLITKDYPNERKPTGYGLPGGSDYIVICEDTDKDGKADKFTNFAEGLSIPTGIAFGNGGLFVSQAPNMLFLKDTNGDDKADLKQVLFSGFGTFDTHAGPSNLHYGIDNWIWGCVGYAGFKGLVGNDKDTLRFSQGLFRFKPDGSRLEYMTATSNNTWGMSFNETGDVFGSTANNAHGWYMAIPNRYFHGGAHLRENGSRSTDTHKDMKPITEKVRQVDVFGGFTAASGQNFYTARAFPQPYWNRVSFVCEPTGHIVHQNVMERSGTDYEDHENDGVGFNLMAGADEWFAPVFAETGPDGAVWVADWYSYIIQHNPTPKGATNGSGNAYETPLRDFTHGRIYRVGYKNAPVYTPITLSKDRPDELVAALKNNNMFWRMTAQRLLIERNNRDVVPQLTALVNDQSVDEVGNNPAAIHALWTLKGLLFDRGSNYSDSLSIEVAHLFDKSLGHPSAAVRKAAVQIAPQSRFAFSGLLLHNTINDNDPLVVLNTLLRFSEPPADYIVAPQIEKAILARLEGELNSNDRWLPDALAVVLASNNGRLMRAYLRQVSMNDAVLPKATTPPAESTGKHSHPQSGKQSVPMTMPIPGYRVSRCGQTAASQPDLLIVAIRTTPESPALRESARIFVDVKNAGDGPIPAGTPVPLAVRIEGPDGVADQVKIDYVSVAHTTGIKAGETVTISKGNNGPWDTDFSVNFDRAGEYTVTVMLDRDNKIAESNEQNNTATHPLTYRAPQSMSAFVLERATRSYASVAPVDSVVALLRQSQKLGDAQQTAVVKGVAEGWNPKQRATVREADQSFLASLSASASPANRDRLNRLYESWGLAKAEPADPNVEVIYLKTVREEMRYDKKEFTVRAGRPVVIVLENPDAMQHNLVIGKPKSMEVIGAAADHLITAKDGAERNYVPTIPQVLVATPLVNPDQTYRLKFTAPAQPGDYPFVCTFPGHWRIMNGTMRVVRTAEPPVTK